MLRRITRGHGRAAAARSLLCIAALALAACSSQPAPSPTPEATPTASPTASPMPTEATPTTSPAPAASPASPTPEATPTPALEAAPTAIGSGRISVGGRHACALREDGSAVCWGGNKYGQAEPPAGERFTAISVGGAYGTNSAHTCALRTDDGSAACWGGNEYGEAEPPTNEPFAAISAGGEHTCALRPDGSAACWGSLDHDYETTVAPSSARERFTHISVGSGNVCAIRTDGLVIWPSPFSSKLRSARSS